MPTLGQCVFPLVHKMNLAKIHLNFSRIRLAEKKSNVIENTNVTISYFFIIVYFYFTSITLKGFKQLVTVLHVVLFLWPPWFA